MGDNNKKILMVFSAVTAIGFSYLFYNNNFNHYSKTFNEGMEYKTSDENTGEEETTVENTELSSDVKKSVN